ncbi:MAG TPA: TIGR03435 family protein [Bryobacteraceae bacterium]|jgi:uncharacterized protein (TIGR03435 family)
MLRAAAYSALFLAASLAQAAAAQSEPPRFEAAAIRPSNPEERDGPSGIQTGPGLVRGTNVTLRRIISGAYGIGEDRVLGGPAWADSDRFQITAKADEPLGEDVLNQMLQTLLAERFHLKIHRETRTGETLILGVTKNAPKLQPAGAAARSSYVNGRGRLEATGVTMLQFVNILSRDLKLPVVDSTGLPGAFNFTLLWNADRPRIADTDDPLDDLRSEMSTAIALQLGLALTSQRRPVEMLAIDHADRPSGN